MKWQPIFICFSFEHVEHSWRLDIADVLSPKIELLHFILGCILMQPTGVDTHYLHYFWIYNLGRSCTS